MRYKFAARAIVVIVRATEQKRFSFMAMESSTVDYHRLSEETRDTVMAYAEQEWPVTKTSVSSISDSLVLKDTVL